MKHVISTIRIVTNIIGREFFAKRLPLDQSVASFCLFFLFIGWPSCGAFAQVAVPDFSIIGERFDSTTNIWKVSKPNFLPKQLAIDYTSNGLIYGFTCEYALTTNTFDLLKRTVQQEVKVAAKIEKPNFCVWRSEERKITVMLELSEDHATVRLIGVSIDKSVRNSNKILGNQ